MIYIPTEHRFANEAAFNAAMAAEGLDVRTNPLIAMDVVGLVPGRTEWHVNMSRREDVAMPASFGAASVLISPQTPKQVWSGVARVGPLVYVSDGIPLVSGGEYLVAGG